MKEVYAVDLFCGCGGMSLGLMQAGWNVVAAVDNSISALATYYANLCDDSTIIVGDIPEKYKKGKRDYFSKHTTRGWLSHQENKIPAVKALFYKNIEELHGWDIMEAAGVDHVHLVCGGPPCQGFSRMNTKKPKYDPRNFLIFEFARIILEINPDNIFFENVPEIKGFKMPDGRTKMIDVFIKIFENKDWDLYYEVLAIKDEIRAKYDPNVKKSCS